MSMVVRAGWRGPPRLSRAVTGGVWEVLVGRQGDGRVVCVRVRGLCNAKALQQFLFDWPKIISGFFCQTHSNCHVPGHRASPSPVRRLWHAVGRRVTRGGAADRQRPPEGPSGRHLAPAPSPSARSSAAALRWRQHCAWAQEQSARCARGCTRAATCAAARAPSPASPRRSTRCAALPRPRACFAAAAAACVDTARLHL